MPAEKPWIPSLPSGRITSHVSYDIYIYINNIISNHNTWDIDKLNAIFLPHEVEAIRRIPIAGSRESDSRFWKFEKKGSYTVRSGYWNTHRISRHPVSEHDLEYCSTKDPF